MLQSIRLYGPGTPSSERVLNANAERTSFGQTDRTQHGHARKRERGKRRGGEAAAGRRWRGARSQLLCLRAHLFQVALTSKPHEPSGVHHSPRTPLPPRRSILSLPFNILSAILGLVAGCTAKSSTPDYGSARALSIATAVFSGIVCAMYLIAAILFFTDLGTFFMISALLGSLEALGGHTSTKVAPSNATIASACAYGCPSYWIGDGICDSECYTPSCAYDAGDCDGHGGGGYYQEHYVGT